MRLTEILNKDQDLNNFINALQHGIIFFVKIITNKKGDLLLWQELKNLVKLF